VDAYRRDLEQFTAGLTKPFFLVSSRDVAEFIEKELAVTSPMTARRKFSALRSFYQFLFMEDVIERNPLRNMRAPKAHKQMIRPISNQEIEQQLDSFGCSTHGLRDRAMLLMFYGSCLRVSELINLRLGDVDFEQRIPRVRLGKGQRDRFAPMNQRQIDALLFQQYFISRKTYERGLSQRL
jgi:integrase/recombinase XerD